MENHSKIDFLFHKFLENQCTKEEIVHLLKYFGVSDNEAELKSLILRELEKPVAGDQDLAENTRLNKIVAEVHDHLISEIRKETSESRHVKRILWPRLSAAVLVFATLALGLYFYNRNTERLAGNLVAESPKNDVLPGKNKAVLTLADGSKIVLDDAGSGVLSNQGGISVRKTADGQLIYDILPNDTQHGTELAYNTIETPKGGQYQVNLPDGTKVWLNAASVLKFPVKFTGSIRSVDLKGEAYFEVAHNKEMPFEVNANTMNVEVLGTHFNVMAYEDENTVTATLLEGAVKVHNNSKPMLLKPGQQAYLLKASGKMSLADVDAEAAVAWKNGYFLFDGEDFHSIMRKISRWYDVSIEYRTDMHNKTFSGTISRFKNVSEVLKLLELTEAVHFKILPEDVSGKERRIVVMP